MLQDREGVATRRITDMIESNQSAQTAGLQQPVEPKAYGCTQWDKKG